MKPETYKLLADAIVVCHFAFVLFVFLGALLVLRWRWVAILHLPAVAWVTYVETSGAICPLTPMENGFLEKAGEVAYAGGFVDHYIIPILYPVGLTPDIQYRLALILLLLTLRCYEVVAVRTIWRRRRRRFFPITPQTRTATQVSVPATSDNALPAQSVQPAGHQVQLSARR